MTEYALYVESGPRQMKTMVHVLDLLGCIAQGPTTGEALEAAPAAIRNFLRFLQAHGEDTDPTAPFTVTVAEHVMKGAWLGQGDPTPGFGPDFQPLGRAELSGLLGRLGVIRAALLELVASLPMESLHAEPAGGGRPIARIVEHVSEADGAYLRATVGKVEGLAPALRAVREASGNIGPALAEAWQLAETRLAAMTGTELSQQVAHGQVTWTARRGLRRMLEHDWEHRQELAHRIEGSPT